MRFSSATSSPNDHSHKCSALIKIKKRAEEGAGRRGKERFSQQQPVINALDGAARQHILQQGYDSPK